MVELVNHMRFRMAELSRERQELAGAEFEPAEHQDLPGEESVPDLADRGFDVVGLERERAERSQAHPCISSNWFMRVQASGGSVSRPAASARRKSSLKCSRWRADCWPPTMTKWLWWPFSHAMNTTPVL